MEITSTDYKLKHKWILWFHNVNDSNWKIESYDKIADIETYEDLILVLREIQNITSGMFFLMKDGIQPIFEDPCNRNGGYWSFRINKKEAYDYWLKLIYYICVDRLTKEGMNENIINGISVSPKINNCIFKIWNNNYKNIKTEVLRKDIDEIKWEETFYLPHDSS